MRSLPLLAIMLGLAGLIPFVAAGVGAISPDAFWRPFSTLALLGYAAAILAFLGGVHWGIGLEVGTAQTVAAQRARFGLGVVPSLVGWAGLLLGFGGMPILGLAVQAAGFTALTVVEARATQAGLVPRSYMVLRWVLSIVVIVVLAAVVIVLSFGGHVVF